MTPTPEMEAFARETATKHFGTSGNGLMIRLMSVAIMEASEKAAAFAKGDATNGDFPYDRAKIHIARAIRNGEYLR